MPLFITSSHALDFHIACEKFVNVLPLKGARILDFCLGARQHLAVQVLVLVNQYLLSNSADPLN